MTLDARDFGPIRSVRRVVFSATEPLRDGVSWAVSPISSAWNGAVHYQTVLAENDELRGRVADLEGQVDALPDVEIELRRLEEASNVDGYDVAEAVTGRVVADRYTGLERIIEIDRGTDSGIEEGMPVVTGRGLVGRVSLATSDRSVVRLMTDPRFSVGAIDPSTTAVGLIVGAGDREPLIADIQEERIDDVSSGARLVTSGFERSRYPAGIPIGRLRVDEETDVRTVEPFADLNRLTYLTVLLVEQP